MFLYIFCRVIYWFLKGVPSQTLIQFKKHGLVRLVLNDGTPEKADNHSTHPVSLIVGPKPQEDMIGSRNRGSKSEELPFHSSCIRCGLYVAVNVLLATAEGCVCVGVWCMQVPGNLPPLHNLSGVGADGWRHLASACRQDAAVPSRAPQWSEMV